MMYFLMDVLVVINIIVYVIKVFSIGDILVKFTNILTEHIENKNAT